MEIVAGVACVDTTCELLLEVTGADCVVICAVVCCCCCWVAGGFCSVPACLEAFLLKQTILKPPANNPPKRERGWEYMT